MLTDEQWQIARLFLPPSPPSGRRGRPPLDQRSVLDAILFKLSRRIPWHRLRTSNLSYQVCYLHYRLWCDSGVLQDIFNALMEDLQERGKFDLRDVQRTGVIKLIRSGKRFVPYIDASHIGSWQMETALLAAQLGACIAELEENLSTIPDPIVVAFDPEYQRNDDYSSEEEIGDKFSGVDSFYQPSLLDPVPDE